MAKTEAVMIDARQGEHVAVLLDKWHGAGRDLPDWFQEAYDKGIIGICADSIRLIGCRGMPWAERKDWLFQLEDGRIGFVRLPSELMAAYAAMDATA